ncbi:cyclin-D6-1 isoform X2 [Olea europaea subsp. europaea]|uniref:Cyclin-D6-1 isoform X2 n=1 Tax=Olea europaea subsp. europaea TaxID=158383 RepID=A0A8S0PGN4_OLEEU|nr:cyclin-D6-1 isoform X2 [Olea europaea subsp. europaea]
MELALENPLASFEDQQYDDVSALFANESDHMPCLLSFKSSDLRFFIRRHALCYGLDPFVVYLSVNYIDRFLSKQEILPWIARILVVATLSLASKMSNCNLANSISDLQRQKGFEFDAHSTQRMEAIILEALGWRMRSITPFSFLNYFISLFEIDDSSLIVALKQRASYIILDSQHELKLLEYKPSTIAASALLCATQDLIPLKFSSFKDKSSSCQYINQAHHERADNSTLRSENERMLCENLAMKEVLDNIICPTCAGPRLEAEEEEGTIAPDLKLGIGYISLNGINSLFGNR